MRLLSCDIAVVGAGPAGSLAAMAAAEKGAEVILLEEHPNVGVPVMCAEGLSLNGLKNAGIKPTSEIVSQQIRGARVYAPNGRYLELTSKNWIGYNVNRDVFDRTLGERAVEAGAKLMTDTRATGVITKNGPVAGIRAVSRGEPIEIKAAVVVGADGYASTVRKTAGLGRWYPDVVSCAQFKLGNLSLEEYDVNEFKLGSKIAPGAYAWVFPKSPEVANVGLGVRRIHKMPAVAYLRRFVNSDPRFRDAEIIMVNGGITPVSGVVDKIVDDGLILVGDAAGQLIPCTGSGVHAGVVAGRMAGEIAAEAVKIGDVSASRLSEYQWRFDTAWGKRIRDSGKIVRMLDKFTDEDLNILAEVLTNEDVLNMANGTDVALTLASVVSRAPLKIVRLMAAFMRG
jgi:digeranylgeranylglycerophospholipid reductase